MALIDSQRIGFQDLATGSTGEAGYLGAAAPQTEADKDAYIKELERINAQLLRTQYLPSQVGSIEAEDVVERSKTHFPRLLLDVEKGVGSANNTITIIEGENYDALRCLRATHGRKFDVIYIDPPYDPESGTDEAGRGFRYNGRRIDSKCSNAKALWLNFMENRLVIAKMLLAHDGYMAISVDHHMEAELMLLCRRIFGEESVRKVTVKMSEAAGVKMHAAQSSGHLAKMTESVIFVSGNYRPPSLFVNNIPKEEWDKNYKVFLQGMTKSLRAKIAELGKKGKVSKKEALALENRLADVTTMTVLEAAKSQGVNTSNKKAFDKWKFENAWRIAQDTNGGGSVKKLVDARRASELPNQEIITVVTSTGRIALAMTKNSRTVLLADDHLTIHPGDLWTDIKTTGLAGEGGVNFRSGKKPLKLIERILSAHRNKDALILDFFAGSGTTAEAALNLNKGDGGNRQTILVNDNEDNICREITYRRCLMAIEKSEQSVQLRYMKVSAEGVEKYGDSSISQIEGTETTLSLVALRTGHWDVVGGDHFSYWVFANSDRNSLVGVSVTRDCWSLEDLSATMRTSSAERKSVLLPVEFDRPDASILAMFEDVQVSHLVDILSIR